MNTRQLALLSVLTALCISIQLTPRPPNIEFTSIISFVVGVIFGCSAGAFLGGMTMFINGFLSPWGFAGLNMPFQIIGMAAIGIIGGLYGKSMRGNHYSSRLISAEAAVLGAFLTLIYDIVTNAGFALLFKLDLIFVLIIGIWFSIIHVFTNSVLFGLSFLPLSKIIKQLYGG
ncbi:hypothetical protein DRO69_01820 [Candidatus Bathyarchaeota archaeon]|nr:MAG: hypothetical protein DRO69_01820 [Candidatus Bathyarchaeota archaeon]